MRLNKRQEDQIKVYFKGRPEVKVVYLYGSQARNEASEMSDVDLGLILDKKLSRKDRFELQLEYIKQVENILSRDLSADIKILDMNKPLEYLHEVVKDARTLVVNDRVCKLDFELQTNKRYFDFYPILENYYQKMNERIEKGSYAS